MSFEEDLGLVIARTAHEEFRRLTADGHPEAAGYRRVVTEMARSFRGEPRSVDEILAEAKASPLPERIPKQGCCGQAQ